MKQRLSFLEKLPGGGGGAVPPEASPAPQTPHRLTCSLEAGGPDSEPQSVWETAGDTEAAQPPLAPSVQRSRGRGQGQAGLPQSRRPTPLAAQLSPVPALALSLQRV